MSLTVGGVVIDVVDVAGVFSVLSVFGVLSVFCVLGCLYTFLSLRTYTDLMNMEKCGWLEFRNSLFVILTIFMDLSAIVS